MIRIFDPPSLDNIGFLIKLINEVLERKMNHDLESFRLTGSQLNVLTYLMVQGEEKTTIRDIQHRLDISHPTAAGLVKRLEQKGFVQTYIDPSDRRARIVRIEPSAQSAFNENTNSAVEMDDVLMKGLSPEERDQLHDLLLRVYANIKK